MRRNRWFERGTKLSAVFGVALLAASVGGCGGDEMTATSGIDGPGTGGGGTSSGGDTSTHTASDAGGGWADAASDAGSNPYWPSEDASTGGWEDAAGDASGDAGATGNTNVNLGGAQDFGYARALLDSNIVPLPEQLDSAGFFGEHHTALPDPVCGERICLQTMLGVLSNLINGNNCTMLQLGLNSPLTADPANRPPLDLTVVVDVSGSMAAERKLEFVRVGLGRLIDSMRDSDRLALVTYSSEASVQVPMTSVALHRADVRSAVEALESGGGTNLYAGLQAGYDIAEENLDSGRQTRVILLSDGEPTVGIVDEDAILTMSRSRNRLGVGITTIGLGTSFNLGLMRGLAELGDGNFYFLENAGAVEEVFEEEINYFTVPVAYDLELELEEGSDYEIRNVHGSRLWQTTESGGRLSVPSVFLAHRESDEDVTDAGGRRGGGSALLVELMPRVSTDDGSGLTTGDVGTATLRFREPGSDRIVEQEISVEYPHAPWILLSGGHFDAPAGRLDIVQKSFVMLNIYVGMYMACEAFHTRGDAENEVEMLRTLIAAVEDYNEEIGDVDIQYDLELLNQLVDVLLANGAVPPPDDWTAPDDGWPAD
ncbi:MAG: VWA domain-containing protein [Myxococcales bacterium]|nr:VWA domain-containing protein [Myxococcales bacterium]MCB9530935.1 VWA domain-containing protein [Myxococcales bacterium]